MPADHLQQWVIYDHPTDYPNHFVVRQWLVSRAGISPTEEVVLCDTLLQAREVVWLNFPDGVRIGRFPEDDPVIAEVWT